MNDDMEQLEDWAKQWDAAQAKGIFNDAAKPPQVSKQTSYDSFFGPQDTHPTESPDDFESKYWKSLYDASTGAPPDAESEDKVPEDGDGVAVIRDHAAPKGKKKVLKEAATAEKGVGTKAKAMAQSANPIRATSVGMDQEMENGALGLTFTPQDIEELSTLKGKLHDLQVKLSTYEGKGESGKRFESQIQSLVRKINELSDSLSQSFPDEIMHQGD